jgi:hypothetical protein
MEESLRTDAQLFSEQPVERVGDVVRVYESLLHRQTHRRGYPRLYRLAWKLLIVSLVNDDWATLTAVYDVFRVALQDEATAWLDGGRGTQERVSVWHLKAVVYCWACLVDSPALGPDDAPLLAPERRRGEADVAQYLKTIATVQCFVNMTPDEAHERIDVERQAHAAPFLLRLSTTMPGVLAVTFVTPLGGDVIDMRLSLAQAMSVAASRDLYADLVLMRLEQQQRQYDATQLAALVKPLLGKYGDSVVDRLRRIMAANSGASAVVVLRQAFWPDTTTRQAEPRSTEERLGLTRSYMSGYATLFIHTCAFCKKCQAEIEEPLCMQVYCSPRCYASDFDRCH